MPAPAAESQEAFCSSLGQEWQGETQIPALVLSEPTAAQADNIHFQLQHTELWC